MLKRHYFEFYEGVHEELIQEYDWFIRFNVNYHLDDEITRPYYISGDLNDVIQDAIGDNEDLVYEVVNNTWVRNPSSIIPSQYNVLVIDGITTVGEYYLDHRLEYYGFKQFDEWVIRCYWNHKTQSYVHWGTGKDTVFSSPKKDRSKITYYKGEFEIKPLTVHGETIELGERLPYEYKRDIVIPLINEMRNKKWNQSHEDIVEHLMEICEIRSHEVKDR